MTLIQKIFIILFILFTGAYQSFAVTAERLEETLSEYKVFENLISNMSGKYFLRLLKQDQD